MTKVKMQSHPLRLQQQPTTRLTFQIADRVMESTPKSMKLPKFALLSKTAEVNWPLMKLRRPNHTVNLSYKESTSRPDISSSLPTVNDDSKLSISKSRCRQHRVNGRF